MKFINMPTLALAILASAVSTVVYSQQREIKESLVFSDPTVAKDDQWVKGVSIDYNQKTVDGFGYNSSGTRFSQSTESKAIGFSAYLSQGNYTLMFVHAPVRYTTSVYSTSTLTINGNYYSNELVVRLLLPEYRTEYFVPYVMGGYVMAEDKQDMDSYLNGVRYLNQKTEQGPGGGIGAIFPITSKYGFRSDVRYYLTRATNTNNHVSAYNYTESQKFIRAHVTAYYNINDNLNVQFGVQNTLLTLNDFFLKVGYTF